MSLAERLDSLMRLSGIKQFDYQLEGEVLVSLRLTATVDSLDFLSHPMFDDLQRLFVKGVRCRSFDFSILPKLSELTLTNTMMRSLELRDMKLAHLYIAANFLREIHLDLPQLEQLTAFNNMLQEFDATSLPSLLYLNITDNSVHTLQLDNPVLERLLVASNTFEELDVSHCTQLNTLQCEQNYLTELDLSGNTALNLLFAEANQLQSIVLPPSIRVLDLSENNLASLDLTYLTNLTDLMISDNPLSHIDISDLAQLVDFDYLPNDVLQTVKASEQQFRQLEIDTKYQMTS
ncbi:MAG: hypothetical protein ACXAE3_11630 [Candidatus Kariarchaeaceae archaeon]|jgi:hypothetical protein